MMIITSTSNNNYYTKDYLFHLNSIYYLILEIYAAESRIMTRLDLY